MKLGDFPVIPTVFEAGADDRLFDLLLLLGPLVIGIVIVLNRSLVTEALAVAYLGVFVAYILYRGIR